MIEFRSVTKQFPDGTVAVEDFSFVAPLAQDDRLRRLLRLRQDHAAADDQPDGRADLGPDPRSTTTTSPAQDKVKLRRSIGYVLQASGLLPHRKVVDNVATVPVLNGVPKAQARADALELLDKVGLDRALAERYPRQLSGGQQQRVGVARALASDPNILLMDEPFGAVDPIVRADLQVELNRLQRELGKTIVFVTHDIDEAFILADQVVIFRKGGVIAQAGTPAEILAEPGRRLRGQLHRRRQGQARPAPAAARGRRRADPGRRRRRPPARRARRRTQELPRRELDLEQPRPDPRAARSTTSGSRSSRSCSASCSSIPLGWLANRNRVLAHDRHHRRQPALHDPVAAAVRDPAADHPDRGPRRDQPRRRADHLRRRDHGPLGRRRARLGRADRPSTPPTAIGYSAGGRFFRVELPLAGPVLLAGIRVVSVSTIALVSVGVIIGSENLGYLFQNGKQRGILEEVVVGIADQPAAGADLRPGHRRCSAGC